MSVPLGTALGDEAARHHQSAIPGQAASRLRPKGSTELMAGAAGEAYVGQE